MKFVYLLILISLPLTDIFSQQDVYLSKRDSIKLKKLGIDLFQEEITINKFQLENIIFHDRRYKVNKAFNIFFQVIGAPYVVLGIVSFATIGRTSSPWTGLNILIGVSSLGLGGAGYGISRPFRRGFLKNKFQRDRIIQRILEESN